jgi:regulator of sigma E protease
MIISVLYVLLALLGLSFLIFIHELGHYYMAKKMGMRVETFAIGFGKPLLSWESGGTKWQVGWLLFGGYVKIAGTDTAGDTDPYQISDGFFGKGPLARIAVAAMGPIVNLVFALLAFALLWSTGGRQQTFTEHTHKIGWVDPHSELYAQGVRPGDEIAAYNDRPYTTISDHLQAPMTSDGTLKIDGYHVDYNTHTRTPFSTTVQVYPHPNFPDKGLLTAGILKAANYINYAQLPSGKENPLPPSSPMQDSGLEYGDRIVWIDGELIVSSQQLNRVLNDDRVLLTIVRDGQKLLKRVPRVDVRELRLDPIVRAELSDWQFEAQLNNVRFAELQVLPYDLTPDLLVTSALKFIDQEAEKEAWPQHFASTLEEPLEEGDRIIAIDGKPIDRAYELLNLLQKHNVHIIVERSTSNSDPINWYDADKNFDASLDTAALAKIASTIGDAEPITTEGSYHLLKAVEPTSRSSYFQDAEKQQQYQKELAEQQKAIDAIADPEKRALARKQFLQMQNELTLGLPNVQDRTVWYNPGPLEMFKVVFNDVARTLKALVTGSLSPKWIAGPVGIVQAVHDSSQSGLRNALYWLGAISLNLGMLNLLPIPVLDGGTIVLSFFEWITGRRLKPKTLEKLILPFAVLLIAFFLFLTFNDVSRLFKSLWG